MNQNNHILKCFFFILFHNFISLNGDISKIQTENSSWILKRKTTSNLKKRDYVCSSHYCQPSRIHNAIYSSDNGRNHFSESMGKLHFSSFVFRYAVQYSMIIFRETLLFYIWSKNFNENSTWFGHFVHDVEQKGLFYNQGRRRLGCVWGHALPTRIWRYRNPRSGKSEMGVKGRAPKIFADHLHTTRPLWFSNLPASLHCVFKRFNFMFRVVHLQSHVWFLLKSIYCDWRSASVLEWKCGNWKLSQLGSGRSFTTLTKFCILFITYQPRVDIPKEIPDF